MLSTLENSKALCYTKDDAGYITLLTMLVIGAIGVVVTTGLLLASAQAQRMTEAHGFSLQARGLADACTEVALFEIKNLGINTSERELSVGAGSCEYAVTVDNFGVATIASEGQVFNIYRKVQTVVTSSTPEVVVSQWQEVAN